MTVFADAAFLRAAAQAADLPAAGPPEIAFAGRSNVGKSSAINALLGRNGLARVSKTPGRTQTINFYALGDAARETVKREFTWQRCGTQTVAAYEHVLGGA